MATSMSSHRVCRSVCRSAPQRALAPSAGRRRAVVVLASEKAGKLLLEARRKYETGDKLGSVKLYEEVLDEDPSITQRQASFHGQTAVHAAFGDVELAQMTLRAAIQEGLDFEQALQDPDLVEITTSQQIIIQLRNFNKQALKAQTVAAARNQAANIGRAASSRRSSDMDLADILGRPNDDRLDIDASPLGIAKRVALLLLVMVLSGTALFFIGLETMFPKY
ncbi:hypothetical protein FOA52_009759 [Chlamydomonas sp. UWO 241]|nr:hypothetical protein FOA52_009759 [Chlamydomonas sp. UWO 241]